MKIPAIIRPILFITLSTFCSFFVEAQETYSLKTKNVLVFMSGAEINGSVKVTLPKGESEVVVTGVANSVLEQSIRVAAGSDVLVMSVSPQNDYLAEKEKSPLAVKLEDSIDMLGDKRLALLDKTAVINEQLEILKNNRAASGTGQTISVTVLKQLLETSSERMTSYLAEQRKISDAISDLDKTLSRLRDQYRQETSAGYIPGGKLRIKLHTDATVAAMFDITYVTYNASWTPSYDVRAEGNGDSLQLTFKANIKQNTGINWEKVNLSLSTGNPNNGTQVPIVNPLYASKISYGKMSNISGVLAGSNVQEDKALNEEVVVVGYSNKKKIRGAASLSSNNYVDAGNRGVSNVYDITIPYTIPSDAQPHLVSVADYTLPASYHYVSAPRLDRDVFLEAQVTGWEKLNLLDGSTNVFFDGAYVGQGSISAGNTNDTLNFSLGRDKKIIVKREKLKDYKADKFIGGNQSHSYKFEITIRNTRSTAADVEIVDQIPVSRDKDIVIEDKEVGKGVLDEETGIIKWKLSLAPNEQHKIQFSYTVKYPKSGNITGLE